MKRIYLVVVACPVLAGCATTMTVSTPATPNDPTVEYVNRAGAERAGFVRTRDASLLAPRLSMTNAELVVQGPDLETGSIPLADVSTIVFRDRSRGAFEGAMVGLGVAAAAGVTVMIDDRDSSIFGSRSDAFLLSTLIAGLVTVPAGAILGALIGHRTTIEVGPAR